MIRLIPVLLLLTVIDVHAQSDWLQWGGPNRDFTASSKGLAASWPATGQKQLWSRPLGAGHSAVLASDKNLYTMYSQGEQEIVIALAADTGKTVWEHKYNAPTAGLRLEYGASPNSTPIIVGDLIFTVGGIGKLFALNKNNG